MALLVISDMFKISLPFRLMSLSAGMLIGSSTISVREGEGLRPGGASSTVPFGRTWRHVGGVDLVDKRARYTPHDERVSGSHSLRRENALRVGTEITENREPTAKIQPF